jgi:transposase
VVFFTYNSKKMSAIARTLKFKVQEFIELTDNQWNIVKNHIVTGRKIQKDLRMVLNCILKVTRTGCQWRNIDKAYGAWQSIYYYFNKWTKNGAFTAILNDLVKRERTRVGKEEAATAGAIDSQSVKQGTLMHLDTGIDGNKKINGRKRNILVDTLGLPMAIYVCAANVHDGQAGIELLPILPSVSKELELIRADSGYKGEFVTAAQYCGYKVEISQKPPTEQGFVPQKGRWQVERAFAWMNAFRRLAKDYEKNVAVSVAFIQLAFASIILSNFRE